MGKKKCIYIWERKLSAPGQNNKGWQARWGVLCKLSLLFKFILIRSVLEPLQPQRHWWYLIAPNLGTVLCGFTYVVL